MHHYLVTILVLCLSLSACSGNNGDDSPGFSLEAELNKLLVENRNYYLLESEGAIKAIDYRDTSQVINLVDGPDVIGAIQQDSILPVGEADDSGRYDYYYRTTGVLMYARDGKLWAIESYSLS